MCRSGLPPHQHRHWLAVLVAPALAVAPCSPCCRKLNELQNDAKDVLDAIADIVNDDSSVRAPPPLHAQPLLLHAGAVWLIRSDQMVCIDRGTRVSARDGEKLGIHIGRHSCRIQWRFHCCTMGRLACLCHLPASKVVMVAKALSS